MTVELDVLFAVLGQLKRKMEELDGENRRLAKENAELWDSVHEREDAITELRAMVNRAHTEAAE